ncbi:MAG: signal recognition particle receptor subunit alpha, partial [Nanoarchaeota archaeon]
MVLEALGENLKNTLKKITQALFVNERLIDELVKDIQRALLQADVQVQLVFTLTKKIKGRALDEKPPAGVSQREHLITIVYEELVSFFGEERKGLDITKKKPFIVMLVGLYGSGKTTTAGKLAKYFSTRGSKIATIGLDVHRPAAPTQLKMVSDAVHVDSYISPGEKNPLKIWKQYEKQLKKYDLVIVDTAGRDALSKDLIKEIEDVAKTINADEKLLVISADIGQAALQQAQQFHQ